MARKAPDAAQDAPTQEQPTQPRPVSPDGRALDQWGLPLGGPARIAALDGRADPVDDPEGWDEQPAPALQSRPVDELPPLPPADTGTQTNAED